MYVGELLKNLDRIPSGVPGLDELIGGGFLPGRVYVVTGPPGSGKTTLGMQFLAEGAKNDEKGLFIALLKRRILSLGICSGTTLGFSSTSTQRR